MNTLGLRKSEKGVETKNTIQECVVLIQRYNGGYAFLGPIQALALLQWLNA